MNQTSSGRVYSGGGLMLASGHVTMAYRRSGKVPLGRNYSRWFAFSCEKDFHDQFPAHAFVVRPEQVGAPCLALYTTTMYRLLMRELAGEDTRRLWPWSLVQPGEDPSSAEEIVVRDGTVLVPTELLDKVGIKRGGKVTILSAYERLELWPAEVIAPFVEERVKLGNSVPFTAAPAPAEPDDEGRYPADLCASWGVAGQQARALLPAFEDDTYVREAVLSVSYGKGHQAIRANEDYRSCVDYLAKDLELNCEALLRYAQREGDTYEELSKYGEDFWQRGVRRGLGRTLPNLRALATAMGDHWLSIVYSCILGGGYMNMPVKDVILYLQGISRFCERVLKEVSEAGEPQAASA